MSAEQCQVRDVLEWIAPNVDDSGVCATTDAGKAKIISALDLALEALCKRIDSEGLLWWWRVPVYSGCFALPEDCLEARQIFVNGLSAIQHDQWFIGKLAYGLRDCGIPCELEVLDVGDFVIPTTLPNVRPIRLGFVAELDGDAGKTVTVELIDDYGERKREELTLLAGQQAVLTQSSARDVTYVGKERTLGPVKLRLCYDNNQQFHFCTYGPMVRSGAFRRKKLPQRFCGCNVVDVHGKRRYYRITQETDILPISDRLALSFAVSAIADLRKRDLEGYNANLTFALNELYRGMENKDSASNIQQVQFVSGFGRNPSQAGGGRCWN